MTRQQRLLWHFFKIDLNNRNDRNAWYLVVEMFWASILGSAASFNAAYAIRLGADNFQVSLLSSIPALVAVVVSFPAGQILERRARRTPWVLGSLLLNRAGYLLVAAAPWLHFLGLQPGLTAVLVLIIFSIPGNFFNIGWTPLLADVIPENRRAAVFTARNIVNQATVCVTVFLLGQWLSRATFPINYQLMFVFGFAASMLSQYCLMKLDVPDSPIQSTVARSAPAARTPGDLIRTLKASAAGLEEELSQHPEFSRITLNTLLYGCGMWMAGPLYTLYFVRQLNASDAWLGLNGTLGCLGTIAGYSLWRWLLSKWGEPVSLKRTIVLAGVYPLLVGLTPNLVPILGFGVLNGLIASGINLSHYNTLLKALPADARPRYTAIYTIVMNLGAFVCPMISLAISNVIGLAPMLVISGLLSIAGSTAFWWHPVIRPAAPARAASPD